MIRSYMGQITNFDDIQDEDQIVIFKINFGSVPNKDM